MTMAILVIKPRFIMNKIYLFLLYVCFATSAFCQTKVENNVEYKAVGLVKDDSTFLALKDTAQKHLPYFIQSLKKHGSEIKRYRFIVKSDFAQKGVHEHMWSAVSTYDSHIFKGIFIDSPFNLKNIKTGDNVTINESGIEDWVIYDLRTGKRIGDFSAKYLDSKH